MQGMDYGTVSRVTKRIADSGDVVAAPHRIAVVLGNLFRYPVSKDRELVIERMVDAHDFFSYLGRHIVSTNEVTVTRCRTWKDATVFPTGSEQCLGVGVQQTRRDGIVTESCEDRILGERQASVCAATAARIWSTEGLTSCRPSRLLRCGELTLTGSVQSGIGNCHPIHVLQIPWQVAREITTISARKRNHLVQ